MSKCILVAEDDPNILFSLNFLFTQAGYTVTTVTNGELAWRALRDSPPDLAVLDVMLPAIDGLELTSRLRADDVFRHTKVLLLSARGRPQEVDAGLQRGADAYVTKPFGTRQLLTEVKRLLID